MPLPDTEYARAKAGFKLLQYMAAGVPVVASPVGINRDLVERSGAGFLADGPEEWEEALRTLLADTDLRGRLGCSGRAFVTAYANLEDQADKIAALVVGPSATP
jgi:glycosyltransferase involved in cell wall biosynthesis